MTHNTASLTAVNWIYCAGTIGDGKVSTSLSAILSFDNFRSINATNLGKNSERFIIQNVKILIFLIKIQPTVLCFISRWPIFKFYKNFHWLLLNNWNNFINNEIIIIAIRLSKEWVLMHTWQFGHDHTRKKSETDQMTTIARQEDLF